MKKLTTIFCCVLAIAICLPGVVLAAQKEPDADPYEPYQASKDAAVDYLTARQEDGADVLYVYRDFSGAENNFTQKAKIGNLEPSLIEELNENWQEDPYAGDSAIEVRARTCGVSWGGWMFLNGYLPEGSTEAQLDFGDVPDAGMDLSGATRLTFWAKGAEGGETVEFFTAGLGYDGETGGVMADYPDSSTKISLGSTTLTDEWKQYVIDLSGADLSHIGNGFGFVMTAGDIDEDGEAVFYLDEIRFEGPMTELQNAPRMIKSYETDTREDPDEIYIQNTAFSYDNALTALAFISDGEQEQAKALLDAFVFAVDNDRYQPDRLRNAYVYGDIRPFPGWASGTRMPGWYDVADQQYYEDQYQVGTNVGNSSFVALALLQYYQRYGGEEYLQLAQTIMDWVLNNCTDETPGFTAGYDGWPEAEDEDEDSVDVWTYKSTEHNIDAYAVFKELYALTGEERYAAAAEDALTFIVSMYDADQKYFYTGTTEDGVTPNKDNVVLDAQVWSLLSLGAEAYAPYEAALDTVLDMQTAEGGYPFHAENTNGGWWPEGTAFTALALREAGRDADASAALETLSGVQLEDGGFLAATVEQLSTGFGLFTGDPWTYRNIPHIAPAAWYVMAVNGFNPYAF